MGSTSEFSVNSHLAQNRTGWQRTDKEIGIAGLCSPVGGTSDPGARSLGFNIQSSYILSFLLPLIQAGQLPVTGESMCMRYWLTA